jgi:AAA domain
MVSTDFFAEGIASWHRIMAAVSDDRRWEVFGNACREIAQYVSQGLDRIVAVDTLNEMATAYGLADDVDRLQAVIADAFRQVEDAPHDRVPDGLDEITPPPTNGRGALAPQRLSILSKAEFIRGFVAPDYLIDGLLQRRFIYALTGQTGHAKTAVALLIGQLVSSIDKNAMLGFHHVDKGRVVYFVGENPDDVRMRVIGSDAQRKDDITGDNISFIPGIFNIAEMFGALETDMRQNGEAALIIVDTSAAYFLGNEELSNTQMGSYARVLRKLTKLPGGPCVLVLCHPIKHVTEPSQLLPRGGGAYLAEMDGNLTLWRLADDLIELHHTKIRGPGFQAMSFKLESVLTEKLRDTKGRLISTVRAVAITQREEDQRVSQAEDDEDRVLAAMLAMPADVGGSFAAWAQDIGWVTSDGESYKKKVERIIKKLTAKKPKLTYENRNKWALTDDGKDAARKAALRFEADRVRTSQGNLI